MTIKSKFHRILSLSAASLALLHSADQADAKPTDATPADSNSGTGGQMNLKTDKLILAPAHQEKLLELYAGHSSHSSHSSHYSGTGGYSTPSAPVYPTYVPSPPPAVYQQPVQPRPAVVVPVAARPVETTNTLSTTNDIAQQKAESEASRIASMKKSAAEGSASAQCFLGLSYLYGDNGVEKNTEKAKMLFELAAIQGNATAIKRLDELTQNEKKAQPSNQEPEKNVK